MQTFYDVSIYLLGELPPYLSFLNGLFAFVLAFIFFFIVVSPFIFLFKFLMGRW